MKRIYLLLNLMLIFLLLTAEQCGETRDAQLQETIVEQRIKGIKTQFESESLSEAALTEFEKSAEQKLSDLTDLLKITGDVLQEQSFRKKAGELILKNFISEDCRVKFIPAPEAEYKVATIGFLVHSALNNNISFDQLVLDSIKTEKPFTGTGESSYQTFIRFLRHSGGKASGMPDDLKTPGEIEVWINKEVKMIGKDSLWVWVLQFGSMK